ncbi:SMR domain-containing protein At5g58720 [Pyrus x bretschneideri]|uniref:SMR domain-containing protein At5g58720 n=1 Tax=Pyrus x bretschneideri TaxID=225117 RepID=UPI00203013A9|nr:SMR domain-containing protein At5g58720 [Pyrus x bretschneideri]
MKHTKRIRKRKSSANPTRIAKEDEEQKVIRALTEVFSSVSLDDAIYAYREADGDANKAAEILERAVAGTESSEEPFTSSTTGGGSDAGSSSGSGSSEGFESGCIQNLVSEKGFRGKQKRVVAAAGTVSTVLGKEYVSSIPRRGPTLSEMSKRKGFGNGGAAGEEEAEQFLCSMLGDESDLSLAVVRDVLCQCEYDVEKALDALLEVSSSYEQSCSRSDYSMFFKEDSRHPFEQSDALTDRASECTSHSSEYEQDNIWNYGKVLTNSEAHSPVSPKSTPADLPQKVLESLFNISKSPEYEPKTMNWKNVATKLQSLAPGYNVCTSGAAEAQQDTYVKGDEYHAFRGTAKEHWDSMRSYYQKAATAYSRGAREHAGYLAEQGRIQTKLAQVADERASQEIFKARNKGIENVITIDLHGQHVKQAMKLLKMHLLFGTYAQSVQFLRVITGYGSHDYGKSKLKQSVIELVENEGIQWSEENRGAVLIKLGSHREFSFLDAESDPE